MKATTLWRRWAAAGAVALWLAGCGGGGGDDASQTTAAPSTVGAAGGSVTGPDGASVVIPAGALTAETTIRIAKDSTGAPPPLPADVVTPLSNTYALTPHGSGFRKRVTVSLPIEAGLAGADDVLVILKAQPGGSWAIHLDARRSGDRVEAEFDGFSYYAVAKLGKSFATGPFAIQIANGAQPGQLAYTISGAMPLCAGGGRYVTAMTDYRDFVVYNGTGDLSPMSSFTNVVTDFPVAAANVAASPRAFVADYLPLPLPADSSGVGVGGAHTLTHYRTVVGAYKCLAIDGSELSFVSNVMWSPPTVVPAPGIALLVDSLQPTTVAPGTQPQAAVTVRALTAENLPQAGVYWDKSLDQGVTWQQVGFVSALSAAPDPQHPASTPPALRYTLALPAATLADNGALVRVRYCTSLALAACAPGAVGPTYGQPRTLSVVAQPEPPVFTQAPRSVIVGIGQSASFSVVTAGMPQILLQWQRLAPGASTWSNVGIGTTNYTTGALSSLDSGAQYRVVASNAAGDAISTAATLVVSEANIPAGLTSQPLPLTVVTGSEAVFAAAARGTEALSYQWRFNGTPILGANSAVLKLPAVTSAAAGSYSIEVSNALGRAVSVDAVLTVNAVGSATPLVAPNIVTAPVDVTVGVGHTATFGVGAGGTSPLSYQWRRNGADIPGATAAVYTIAAAGESDNGDEFAVVVSNAAGSVGSGPAVLRVIDATSPQAPQISTQPAPLAVLPGGTATLAVAASGTAPLAYQWSRNGTPIAGASGAVLVLANVTGLDAGSYSVNVSNGVGNIGSNAAPLIVIGAPAITNPPAATAADAGKNATFSVGATGDALRYQWTRNQVGIPGATAASYTTPALTNADNGAVYGVIVYNGAGLLISPGAVLTVAAAPAQWQSAAAIETDDTGDAQTPSIAVNAAGHAVAVWMQPGGGVGINIWANRYTPAGGWGTAQVISDGQGGAQGAQAVAIDANGNATAVWQQADSIWANRYTAGSGWGTPVLIESGSDWAGNPQVGVDAGGNVIAVWWQRIGGRISTVANRYVAGSGWGSAAAIEADDSGDTSAPQIAVDAAGNAVAVWAWSADTGGSNFVYNVWANRYVVGVGWGSAAPIDSNNTAQPNPAPQVALGADGNAIAVWHRPHGSFDSVVSSRYTAGVGWGSATLLETDPAVVSRNARVAIDPAGNAIAVWEQYVGATANVMASRYTAGAGWGAPVLIEIDDAGSAFTPQIVIDANGAGTAMWSQRNVAGFTFNIWANRYVPGSGWGSAVAIDGQAGPARQPALGVDASGRLVAVWEQTVGALSHLWASVFR